MRQLRAWYMRFRGLFNKSRRDRELAAEFESHVQMHVDDNLRAGMSKAEARRNALMQLGGEQTKESYRDQGGVSVLEHLFQDVRFGARMLRKSPGFTLVAVLTLALGIGANAAMFSLVNSVLLRPLPYKDSERLMAVWTTDKDGARVATAVPDFQFLRQHGHNLESLAGYYRRPINVTGTEQPERTLALVASSDFFPTLGVAPASGRAFLPRDEEWGQNHIAIISDGMWRRSFGADPETVGRTLRLNGEPYTIVGILAPDFWFLDNKIDLMVPLSFAPDDSRNTRSNHFLSMVGRLRPDVPPGRASSEVKSISN
ncbi:MAG TPA: ABC transporter permease, partial [Alphaproteobacteria bacterium]|nr:ABC transporter permease [Alphaproteobacteria bacterium]